MNSKRANTSEFKQFIKEYEIMSMHDHPNILKVYGIFLGSMRLKTKHYPMKTLSKSSTKSQKE